MKVINGYPPNRRQIFKAFPEARKYGVMFCYGDTIYAPGRSVVPAHHHAHEWVHSIQQAELGSPDAWWDKYIESVEFRLAQEIPAHRAEYYFLAGGGSRQVKRKFLREIARKMSLSLYGFDITKKQAMELLK